MKTFVFTTHERREDGVNKVIAGVYEMVDNKPNLVGYTEWRKGYGCTPRTNITLYLVGKGIIPKEWAPDDWYDTESEHYKIYEL